MEEIIIAESMAVNITDWPFLIIVLGIGVTIGMYISSQLKEHIRRNINRNNLIKNLENGEKKRKK